MNKQELVEMMMEKNKMPSKAATERFVNSMLDAISDAVAKGDTVQLIGFGTFEARQRAAREARNPQDGGTVHIPAKKVPAFKPGKAFKEKVNV